MGNEEDKKVCVERHIQAKRFINLHVLVIIRWSCEETSVKGNEWLRSYLNDSISFQITNLFLR